jgi:hypothetical protein
MQTLLEAYIECALWSSTDGNGKPLDSINNLEISDELHELMTIEARLFEIKNQCYYKDHMTDAQAGHDFWLTRNGHGAGFWDRDLPNGLGDLLTKKAKAFSTCDLYIDDGKLYGM